MDITVSMHAFVSPAMPMGIKKALVEYARKRVLRMKGRGLYRSNTRSGRGQ
jgi:hypothetical protein